MPAGRPPKLKPGEEINTILAELGTQFATEAETASILGVDINTLKSFWSKHPEARESFLKGQQDIKVSLRRKQVELAMAGDKTMLIWLGKNYLGQTDKLEAAHTGAVPIIVNGVAAEL